MSSILEALRKVEEQKSARRQQPVDLTKGVLKARIVPQRLRIKPWQLAVACVAVAVVSMLVTLLAVRPDKRQVPATAAVQALPAPAAPGPAVPQLSPLTVVPHVPAADDRMQQPETTVVVKPASQSRGVQASAPARKKPQPVMETQVRQPITEPVVTPVAASVPVHLPAPALKLTGIGWQKDAAARYAVINGTAIAEGGVVDGARIEEILPDKVRIRVDGQQQEIHLGK